MSAKWPWSVLGLKGPADVRDVKRAYAKALKSIDRDDAAVFQDLRAAFEAAKSRAAVRQAHRLPSMREAAQGQSAKSQPQPAPSSPAPDPVDADVPDTFGLQSAGITSDVEDQTADPEPDGPEGPVSPPLSDLPGPWQDETDPDEPDVDEEEQFFADLYATFSTGVWKMVPLENLMSRDIAMDRDIRDRVENILFDRLSRAVEEEERTIPGRVAKLMEQHFDWASDGVRFNKKFGWRSGAQMVSYDVSRALDRTHRTARPQQQKPPMHGKIARSAMVAFLYAGGLFVLWSDGLSEETFLFAAVISAIVFGIMWCVMIFAYSLLSVLGSTIRRIPAIDSLADRIWRSWMTRSTLIEYYDRAMHLPGPRSTIFFAFGFLASMALLIAWGLERLP